MSTPYENRAFDAGYQEGKESAVEDLKELLKYVSGMKTSAIDFQINVKVRIKKLIEKLEVEE